MHKLLRICVVIFLVFLNATSLYAGEIKGHVYDRATREQAIGAYVVIKSINKVAITGLDGSYHISNLEAGTYKLTISYVGYHTIDTLITLKTSDEVVKLDVYQQSTTKELKQVEVTAKAEGGSDAYANNKEKNADNVMNILSARAIQISPDITVSEVMQRVSGVAMESNSSSGAQYAVIRGMDKKYNTTLVNGVKIPSPDDKDRFVPLDMFPAELLERLEVIKTLTPSMEADATGGSMNLVMKNAPDKLLIEGNVAVGYNTAFQNQNFQKYSTASVNWKSPEEISGPNVYAPVSMFPSSNLVTSNIGMPLNTNASLSLGNRFFKDKLGVIVSGSYQNTYSGYNTDMLLENGISTPTKDVNTNNIPGFADLEHRQYSLLSKRLGTIAKLDYKINDRNTISLFGTHIELDQYRVRDIIDSTSGGSTFNNTWTNIIGVKNKIETRTTLQSIDNVTLQGTHKLADNFSADWSLVGSEAKRLMPNDAQFSYASKLDINKDPNTGAETYVMGKPYFPYVTGQTDEWQHNTDKDIAAYANLHYKINFIPFLKLIDVGGLYRHKNRDNYDNQYSLDPVIDLSGYQQFTTIPDAKLQFTVPSKAYGNAAGNAGIYTFNENLTAYYAQAHIDIGELTMLGGLRVENTQQDYNSSLPVTLLGKTATYNYTDLLPSIQAKYNLNHKAGLRFSYFKSLYRPAFSDLIPFLNTVAEEDYPRIGNPFLNHSVIHNADVRYELFPKGLDEIMIGGFYKYIINPIEDAVVPITKTQLALEPGNFGNATNYGVELVLRKFFGSFGVSGSYTYTNSDINSDKVVYHQPASASDSFYTHVKEHRPLQGQAAHIGNISLLYKNVKQKIEAQVGLVYTGERIVRVSYYRGLDDWQKPTLNLDFSVQKQFGKHFIVYIKLKNLLNTGSEIFIKQTNTVYNAPAKLPYQESPNYYTVEKDYYYSSMLFGIRYKLD